MKFRVLAAVACAFAVVTSTMLVRAEGPSAPTTAPATAPTMEQHTLVLLVLRDDAPKLSPDDAAALQKRHLGHIASMSKTGKVLAAGPFSNRDDEKYRGILIFATGIDEARKMCEQDPAVLAGRLKVVCQTWNVPAGTIAFLASELR
jgi:uncharacterized protein YciI